MEAKGFESLINTQSEKYLENLPKFRYNFEDVLSLGKFLISRRRLLVVSTVDTTLEAARIYNILHQLDKEYRNPINPGDLLYIPTGRVKDIRRPIKPFLGGTNQTFLHWKQSRYFKAANSLAKFTNLVIIDYSTLLENHDESPANLPDLMTYIFADKTRKVILIYHRKDAMDPQLQLFNLDYFRIVKKQISSISFNDLTKLSQRQVMAHSLFMFKDAPTNLRNFLEIGECHNLPKEIINRFNQIVKSDTLKAMSTQNFTFKEISSFFYSPQICDVNPTYLNVFKEISLENIILFLANINMVSEELGKPILILINCPSNFKKVIKQKLIESSNNEDSTTSKELKSLIFSLEDDQGQTEFLRVCKNNPDSRIYWIICKDNSYCLKKIYDTHFYIKRQFSNHVIDKREIKNVFTQDCTFPDLFIFDNIINKSEFCQFLNISLEEYKQINENIVMVQEGKNRFNLEINRNNDRPVHLITFDKKENELIWVNSKGSLENLRNFISTNDVQIDELALSKREVIILGGPAGVGKSTCLISLLRHIPPTSWIIKRNFKDCKNLIQELPPVINVDVVASFLSADCQDRLFVSRLLADFLSNKISKSLYILFEDVDEILNDLERLYENEVKMVKIKQLGNILQFLKRNKVYIWFTSKSEKNIRALENMLSSFSTNIIEIKVSDQKEFLINSWQAKLSLGCEISLNRQKEMLLEHAQEVINILQPVSKLHSEVVGIPFQLKVIQEVTEINVDNFNKKIYGFQGKFENLSKILKKFIRVNYEYFFENSFENYQKNGPSDPGNFREYLDLYFGALAFKQIFPYSGLTLESYKDLNFRNVHFLQSTIDGESKFIHCIFEDYFAAVAIISWIMDSTFSIEELFVTEILIKPKYKVLRIFLNQLIKIAAASSEVIDNFARHISNHWKQNTEKGIIKNGHLLFHVMVEENLGNIALLFLNKSFLLTELIPFFVARNTSGKTALFLAAENRLDVIVDIILKRFLNEDTNSQQKLYYATLFSKSAYEDKSTNKYLINKIKYLNENSKLEEELQETQKLADSLFETIPNNNINALKERAKRIKNETMLYYVILWTNDESLTVLHLAASKGYVDIVRYLLKQNIPVDLLDQHGSTPLHHASECGSLETVKCLKEHGSICNITNDTGMSPLAISAKLGHLNIVWSLIEAGASWKKFDQNNIGPLEYAARRGHLDIVECLVEHGCDFNHQDKFGMTAISWATKLGHLNVVKYLVAKQTDLSILDCHGRNLLQIAILSEQWTIVKYLIFCEVNINNMTYNGVSPLQMAVGMGNWDIVKMLIAEGAQTNVVDQYNFTPIQYAAKVEKWPIVVHMVEQGAEIKDLEAVLEIILNYVLCNNAVNAKPPTNPFNRQYNKFYNIIRLGNTDLLNLLIKQEDLGNDSRCEELTQLLAESYEELHLRNVPLCNKMKYCVEEKLVVLRGFGNILKKNANTINDNKNRVESIITEIIEIHTKYVLENSSEADQELLIRIRFIAENIQILKRCLRHTYNIVPWEEMEFCLVIFISLFIQTQDDDFCYRLVMDQNRIIMHLVNFMDPLLDIQYESGRQPANRLENIKNIKEKYKKLKNLFKDYNIIKDIYSLKRVSNYIKMALSVKNAEDEEIKPFAIQRCLQVIGESFKNTVESPNLSEEVNNFLWYFAPRNFKNVLTQLRDKLSHSHTLKERIEIENVLKVDNEFLQSVQSDLSKIIVDVVDILSRKRHEALRVFATKIKECNTVGDIKQLTRYIKPCEFSDLDLNDHENVEIKKLKSLLLELRDHVDDTSDEIISLHRTVLRDINDSKPLATKYFINGHKIYSFIETGNYVGLKNLTNIILTSYQRRPKNQTWTLLIMSLLGLIVNKFSLECPSLYNQIVTILELITKRGQIKNIEKIKDMEEKNKKSIFSEIKKSAKKIFDLQKNEKKAQHYMTLLDSLCKNWNKTNIDKFLKKAKLSEEDKKCLSNLIDSFDKEMQEFERNIQTKLDILDKYLKNDISSLKTNDVIVSGIEMLSLDVIDWLLETSRLAGHQTSFDDYSPVLIGRSLRNHLAHRNCLIDSLPFSTLTAIFSTIQKISTKGDDKTFQEAISTDLHKNKFNNMINIVTRQSDFFKNLMNGTLKDNDETKATDINGKTALEYAIMSNNFDLVKVFLEKENNFGTRCFFTAVKLGALLVIKCISSEIRNCRILSRALLIAAESDHKDVAMELLALGANINIQDEFLRTPLDVAMENGHHDVADSLLNPENKVATKINDIYNILYRAASRGYENVIKILVNLNSFKIVQPEAKLKALGLAAENGHTNIATILLKYILNVNAYLGSERKALYMAVENGHKDVVEVLLDHGADPNVPETSELNNTSLHIACLNGHKDIVDLLISEKANTNAKNKNKNTPLHMAAHSGFKNIVETLIHHKADVNARTVEDSTPIIQAAFNNHRAIIEVLVKNGADVNVKMNNEFTALQIAAFQGHEETVISLLENNADYNVESCLTALYLSALNGHLSIVQHLLNKYEDTAVKNNVAQTAFFVAVNNNHNDIVNAMIKHNGVNINDKDEHSRTALNRAVINGFKEVVETLLKGEAYIDNSTDLESAVLNGHTDIVEMLLSHGAGINECPLLHIAAEYNYVDIVKLLLDRGAQINAKYTDDFSALHRAVQHGCLEIVKNLLDRGADVNAKGKGMVSPLILAAEFGFDKIALTLIKWGADVNAVQTDNYFSVLEIAANNGHEKIVRDLLKNGADPNLEKTTNDSTALHLAAAGGHLGVVSILLNYGANVNALIEGDFTALNLAIRNGYIDIVEEILDHNLYVNMHLSLLIAAEFNHIDIVNFLLERGANKNDRFEDGRSVLHRAVENRHCEVVNVLLDHEADVNVKENNNVSPLHLAAENGYDEIALTLIKRGANVDAVQLDFGLSALHMAAKNGHEKIVRYLLENGANPNLKEKSKYYTALHLASFEGHSGVVSILVNQEEIEVDAITKDDFTALHLAARKGRKVIVEKLLEHGANYGMGLSLEIALQYDYKDIVSLLLNKISFLAYAQIIRNKSTVIAKPTSPLQVDITTKSEAFSKINPVESSITINKACPTKDGGIVIGCKNSEDMMTFCNLANDRMINKFDMKEVNTSNPKIQIVGITEDLSEDELVQCLKLQNEPFICADSECKILEYWHNSNNIFQAVVELDVATYLRLSEELSNKHLLVGYNSCVIYDAIEPLRCFNCSGYNHTSKNCNAQKACPKCSQEHKLSECESSTVKCINCINTPSGSSGVDVNHAAWDKNCPVYKNQLSENRAQILGRK